MLYTVCSTGEKSIEPASMAKLSNRGQTTKDTSSIAGTPLSMGRMALSRESR
jgi:hypothetical protein